jgi:hemin uptake protein HemP
MAVPEPTFFTWGTKMDRVAQKKNRETDGARDGSCARRKIAILDGRIDSRDLFVGTREIVIAHGAEIYRLRLTAQNKLILTK